MDLLQTSLCFHAAQKSPDFQRISRGYQRDLNAELLWQTLAQPAIGLRQSLFK